MITIVDAPPGYGKTSWAINHMNEEKFERFIYITPYKDELKRVIKSCDEREFVQPNEKLGKGSKRNHFYDLIESGVNMQLEYADLSLIKLGDLSDRIKEIKDCTLEFEENVREIVNNNNLEKKLFEEGRKNNGEFDVVINDLEIHYNQIINISFKMDEAFNKLNNTLKENDEGFQDIIMDMKQLFIDNNCNLSEVIKEVERCKSIIDFNINIADKVESYKNIIL